MPAQNPQRALQGAMEGRGNVSDVVRQVAQRQQMGRQTNGLGPVQPIMGYDRPQFHKLPGWRPGDGERNGYWSNHTPGGGGYGGPIPTGSTMGGPGTPNIPLYGQPPSPQQQMQRGLGVMQQSNQPVQGSSVFAPPRLPTVPQTMVDQALTGNNVNVSDIVRQAGSGTPTVAGGPPVDPNYLTPAGNVENMLYQLFGGGAGGFQAQVPEFTQQLARGEIPTGTQAAFNDMWRQQAPRMLERFGGARFGTDALRSQGDTYMRGMNNLLAQSEDRGLAAGQQVTGAQENAIQRWLGLGSGLMGSEVNRNNLGFQLLLQDLMRQSGIPPELTALTTGGFGGSSGGGLQFPQQTSTLGTLLAGLGPMFGGLISGLPGAFGGGGAPSTDGGGSAWGDWANNLWGDTAPAGAAK